MKTIECPGASSRILDGLGFRRTGVVTDDNIGEAWGWIRAAPGATA